MLAHIRLTLCCARRIESCLHIAPHPVCHTKAEWGGLPVHTRVNSPMRGISVASETFQSVQWKFVPLTVVDWRKWVTMTGKCPVYMYVMLASHHVSVFAVFNIFSASHCHCWKSNNDVYSTFELVKRGEHIRMTNIVRAIRRNTPHYISPFFF